MSFLSADKEKKILIILPNLKIGGAEKLHINLAEEWTRKGCKVEFVLMKKEGEYLKNISRNIVIKPINVDKIRHVLFPLLRYIQKSNPDYIISAMWPLTSVSILAWMFSGRNGKLFVSDHINLMQGYLNDLDDKHTSRYDAFVSFNYIEHQPDTKSFISSLLRIAKPGAIGYITAPNINYLLKTNSLYEFVADHLVYFSEETICRAFETNGFDVIESKIINNENDIAITVKKREIKGISGIDNVNELVKSLKSFVDKCKIDGKKLAIWGAGHRTLALLSIARINDIDFIVDSADFKQGKYSPIMHSKIVSPAILEKSDIDIVIVMVPGLYPDEVVNKIKSFKRSFEIYKLQDNKLCPA